MRRNLFRALITVLLLTSVWQPAGLLQAGEVKSGSSQILFNSRQLSLDKWRDTWDDGQRSGAKITMANKLAVITGTETNRNYGVVYQYLNWDLDRQPYIEIDVVSANTEWFMLIENPELANGYLKLQGDTAEVGKRAYNVRRATGLKGRRRIRLEIGITTNERTGNIGLKMKIAGLKLAAATSARIIKVEVLEAPPEDVTLQTQLLGWNNRWKGGQSSGAFLTKKSGNLLRLTGDYKHQEFGCVYRRLTLDFAEYPKLEVNVAKLSANMYLIFEGPQFRGGYYRLKPSISKPGNYIFDFGEDLAYLEGPQEFTFNLGVTTGNPALPVKDHTADFTTVKFIGQDQIKLVAGFIPSQLIQPPPPLVKPQAYQEAGLPEAYRIGRQSLDRGSILKLFGQKYRSQSLPRTSDTPKFREQENVLTVSNQYYQVELDPATGAFLGIEDKIHSSRVCLGSEHPYLWRIMFKQGDFQNAQEFLAESQGRFAYQWREDRRVLELTYTRAGSVMRFDLEFSARNYFDLKARFTNGGDQIVTAVDIPRLCYDYRKLEKFYLPYAMGVAFNQTFFKSKRQWKTTYPLLFSDFVNWSLEDGGQFAAFLHWADQPVRPTRINVGYSPAKGECGIYEHGWTTYIKPGKTWESQPLRMVVGEQVETALQRYKQDNGLTRAPLLAEKLGGNLLAKVKKGVLLKISLDMNRDFDHVKTYLPELPFGTIVHFVTWWLEGFDRHMPDFWPVNPTFGNNRDFKETIALAKENDLVVMPYVNNTFWNTSPTLQRVGGPDVIACKNLQGDPIFEVYPSGGKGWATSPRHPQVKKQGEYIAKKFFNEYDIDILFLDQIGARFINYDLNPTLRDPTAYAQGWLENCRKNIETGPLYTEQGYDRLIPVMSAFCGMSSFTLPESLDYNTWWGEDSWEYFPMAQYLAHEHVLFYHHNLAHEVFSDTHRKIAFYLAHGYNMYNGRWVAEWNNQKKWFQLADQIQKNVVSKYVGKPLLNYAQIAPKEIFWSAYPEVGILANLSLREYPVLNHAVAPNGFIASNQQGTFLAGRFTRFYGFALNEPQYLVLCRKPKKIIITQMENKNSLLTIPRPAKWHISGAISARQGKQEVPLVAITPWTITFHTGGNVLTSGAVKYIIEYVPERKSDFALKILTPHTEVAANANIQVGLEAKNKTRRDLENVQLFLSAWLVKRNQPVIQDQAGFMTLSPEQYLKSDTLDSWQAGKKLSAEFPLRIPSTAEAGDMLWLKGELVSQAGEEVERFAAQSALPVTTPFEARILPPEKSVSSGEWVDLGIQVKNNFSKKISGRLKLNLPEGWRGKKARRVSLKSGQARELKFRIKSPATREDKTYEISATFHVQQNQTKTPPIKIPVSPLWRVMSVEGPRILVKDQASGGRLRLIMHSSKQARGKVKFKTSAGLEVEPKELDFKIAPGGERILRYRLIAAAEKDQRLKMIITSEHGKQTVDVRYPVLKTGQAMALTGDLLNRGDDDVILANAEIEVQALRDLGGRIMSFYYRKTGANMLYQNYPTVAKQPETKDWLEFGGINDWFPTGWPGFVWNNRWDMKVLTKKGESAVVSMSSTTENGLRLERRLIMPAQGRRLQVDYIITNEAGVARRYQWFNHPDLAPGLYNYAGDSHRIIIPLEDPEDDEHIEIFEGKFNAKIGKDSYRPAEGWVVALDGRTGNYFMQQFDVEQVTQIGVWQDAIFYTMELLTDVEKIEPGGSNQFTIYYLAGDKNWEEDIP